MKHFIVVALAIISLAPTKAEAIKAFPGTTDTVSTSSSAATYVNKAGDTMTGKLTATVSSSPVVNVSTISAPGTLKIYTSGGDQVAKFDTVGMIGNTASAFSDSTLGTLDLYDTGGGDLWLRRYDTSVTPGDNIGQICFRDRDSSTGGSSNKLCLKGLAAEGWGSGASMEVGLHFSFDRYGGGASETFIVTSTGVSVGSWQSGVDVTVPQTNLDVYGNAQFGSGATKSTFTATGALTLAAAAPLTVSSATFIGVSVSTETAGAAGVAVTALCKVPGTFAMGGGCECSGGVALTGEVNRPNCVTAGCVANGWTCQEPGGTGAACAAFVICSRAQ